MDAFVLTLAVLSVAFAGLWTGYNWGHDNGHGVGWSKGYDDCIDETLADGWIEDDDDKRYILVPKDASVSDLAKLWKD